MSTAFENEWVVPFYLAILHGNYATSVVTDDERTQFNRNVRHAMDVITPAIATKLISGFWRSAITGSWFAGLKCFTECRSQIGELLLASKTCYAGQSHAFAMACFADDASVEYLVQYLNTYLRKVDCYYDQNWAMPALMWIDQQRGTTHAAPFLTPGGLWERFTADKVAPGNNAWTIGECISDFWRTMEYCRTHFIH